MYILLTLVLIIFIARLEKKWPDWTKRNVSTQSATDKFFVEPGENFEYEVSISNSSRRLTAFVHITEYIPERVKIHAKNMWKRRHISTTSTLSLVDFRLNVRRRSRYVKKLDLSIYHRGCVFLGEKSVACGDVLGLTEKRFTDNVTKRVVCLPYKLKSPKTLNVLGSFMGDISVRRFIIDDPVLTVGFNDYTGREPFKSISWTKSAQAGKLMVKRYDHTIEQKVSVLLNVFSAKNEEIEEILCLARMACEYLESKNIPYALVSNGRMEGPMGYIEEVEHGLGNKHLESCLYALGCADYVRFYSFNYLVEKVLNKAAVQESYVVVSTPFTTEEEMAVKKLNMRAQGEILSLFTGTEEYKAAQEELRESESGNERKKQGYYKN